jgi:hypothetical protein
MPEEYFDALTKSKGTIRSYVYGDGIDEGETESDTAAATHS